MRASADPQPRSVTRVAKYVRARFIGLLVALVIALGCVAARAEDDAGWYPDEGYGGYEDTVPDPGQWGPSLAPYGQWVDDGTFGNVWQPAVPYGWRPYVDGSWVWTSYGWTW